MKKTCSNKEGGRRQQAARRLPSFVGNEPDGREHEAEVWRTTQNWRTPKL